MEACSGSRACWLLLKSPIVYKEKSLNKPVKKSLETALPLERHCLPALPALLMQELSAAVASHHSQASIAQALLNVRQTRLNQLDALLHCVIDVVDVCIEIGQAACGVDHIAMTTGGRWKTSVRI